MASINVQLEIFQCSVCKTIPHSKILQCSNGHLACAKCSARITVCPVCRAPLDPNVDKRTRALVAEQAIDTMNLDFACTNDGCTYVGPKKDLVEHEELCEFVQFEGVNKDSSDASEAAAGGNEDQAGTEEARSPTRAASPPSPTRAPPPPSPSNAALLNRILENAQ